MSPTTPSTIGASTIGASRSPSPWWSSGRRRLFVVALALVLIAGAVIGITNAFASGGGSNAGYTGNGYPTTTATVTRQSLSEQTQVDATLGDAGNYTINLPMGTTASTLAQDRSTVQSDEQKVSADEAALASAEALATPTDASTLLSDEATVNADTTGLDQARSQLTADRNLGCPAASSATVTTPQSGSSPSSNGSSSDSDNSSDGASNDSGNDSSTEGKDTADLTAAIAQETGAPSASAPSTTTGSVDQTASTSTELTGTIDPDGADTTYYFKYGRSSSFGSTTTSRSVGAGTSPVSVSATITGLRPDTTYGFALVATNALGTSVSETQTFRTAESSCVAQTEVVNEDVEALETAKDALAADRLSSGSSVTTAQETLTADQQTLAAAEQLLSSDEASAANSGATFSALPDVGAVLRRGQSVYSLDGQRVPLFYGTTTPYRALYFGVSNGPDVAELNANLAALGFGSGIATSDAFSRATEAAVEAWQTSLGIRATGVVSLGDVVVEPGPIEVDAVTPTTGAAATPGSAVLTATSTTPVVTIALDASLQSEVKVGDPVTVTLPDNTTTPGVISSVSDVATSSQPGSGSSSSSASSSSSSSSSSSGPTITVLATLSNPKAAGDLSQAPVEVSITNASVQNVLAVPVDALLALASGGYAIETVPGDHLVAVAVGLFDDAAGLVQVSGSGLSVGERIVVPNL